MLYRGKINHIGTRDPVEILDIIFEKSVSNNVSDIHIDPKHNSVKVRVRIDGIMYDFATFDVSVHESVIARLKILSGTRTDVHDFPQDGRFNTTIKNKLYSVRVSFMPTFFGENAVLRVLEMKQRSHSSLVDLGFSQDQASLIRRIMDSANGIILVTGPTGSGKTTTLHTCLLEKAKSDISVITLEDPIEYEIDGVRQIHVKQNQGVTFANVLRSVLRQDPDVIMVGEIRDVDTANIAMHTALTGHLVLSTLHTNSAVETITRLVDMGIEPYILSSTLKLIVSQRLIRSMCRECMSLGCEPCMMTGYKSRTIIAEVLEIEPQLRTMISRFKNTDEISQHLSTIGWRDLYDFATEKVDWGITNKLEVLRVLGK